ncbi:hypothetical protein Pelo_1169 [Pelomyxa schiedti]|nr:hypothetical protein Pelo_1169 [Pelomyxa schiedti]
MVAAAVGGVGVAAAPVGGGGGVGLGNVSCVGGGDTVPSTTTTTTSQKRNELEQKANVEETMEPPPSHHDSTRATTTNTASQLNAINQIPNQKRNHGTGTVNNNTEAPTSSTTTPESQMMPPPKGPLQSSTAAAAPPDPESDTPLAGTKRAKESDQPRGPPAGPKKMKRIQLTMGAVLAKVGERIDETEQTCVKSTQKAFGEMMEAFNQAHPPATQQRVNDLQHVGTVMEQLTKTLQLFKARRASGGTAKLDEERAKRVELEAKLVESENKRAEAEARVEEMSTQMKETLAKVQELQAQLADVGTQLKEVVLQKSAAEERVKVKSQEAETAQKQLDMFKSFLSQVNTALGVAPPGANTATTATTSTKTTATPAPEKDKDMTTDNS